MGQKVAGFSLIELLVVIAIIGILSSVGVVGYQDYIERSKEQAVLADFNAIERLLTTENITITNDMGNGSEFSTSITAASLCEDWRDRVISRLNTSKKNHFDKGVVAVDGNNCGSGAAQCTDNGDGTKSWKQGQYLLFCADECAALNTNNFKLKGCACRNSATCTSLLSADTTQCGTPPNGVTC